MPSFVNMASLTKLASLTGNEEFQVSATQKVTAQQIAELSLSQMLSGFSTLKQGKPSITANIALLRAIQILYKLSSNGSVMSISNGTDKFGTVTYSGSNAVGILFDVKASKYYTRSGATTTTSYTDAQWITWLQAGNVYEMGGSTGVADPIQIHDFAEVVAIDNWPTPKDGLIIPFTTDSGVLNKPGNESEYVGIIICEVDTQQTGRAEVIAYGSGTGSCYIGLLDWASISIEWMVNKLSVSSKKLSAFTGTAIGNYVQSMGDSGDLFPFTTVNANKTAANQFPANGAWSGFVTIGDGGGINIIAFKSTTDPKAEVYVGRCGGSTTQWTAVGGGGAVDPIYIGSDESITMIVENHSWDKDGEIVPVFIEPSSDIYDQLPQIKNASFPQAESTIVGYAQRVYDGGDYQHIGLTFTIWETSGRIAYRGEILMNNSGDVMETMLTPIGTFASPIPGFTKIANQYDLALSTGSLITVNFNYEVIASTAVFIDAELRSSAGPNGDIRSVAIPVTFFNPVQAATLMDLNTRSIASGTNIGQIRLNVASVVTGAKGIQGLQVVVVSNNLSNPADILRIKGVYANI